MTEQKVKGSSSGIYRENCTFIIQILISPGRDCLKLSTVIPVLKGAGAYAIMLLISFCICYS